MEMIVTMAAKALLVGVARSPKQRLGGPRNGRRGLCRCPVHDHWTPSRSTRIGDLRLDLSDIEAIPDLFQAFVEGFAASRGTNHSAIRAGARRSRSSRKRGGEEVSGWRMDHDTDLDSDIQHGC